MLGILAIPARAQETPRIRAQRDELTRIRLERAELERQMRDLQSTAHDLREEVTNLKQRADVTARLIHTLDNQLVVIDGDIRAASANMVHAENELSEKKQVLRHRLVDIYKRGPLFTTQALLSAESFGDLVARYKYLHMLALRDRSLVKRVEVLRNQVGMERDRLVLLQRGLANNRGEKRVEEDRLRGLEQEQRAELAQVQSQTRQTQNRIARMKIAETQLSNTISALETERRRVEAARPASAPRAASTIKTSDYGRLDWPVEGPLVYTYGRAVQQNNTAIRWNGVGIEAREGTAVRSVAAGRVVSVRQLGTYGLTIIMEHGAGDYSVYGSLSRADVREGQLVPKGQIIGGVGISDPELPPHLHFEIRHGGPAMDPAAWLRRR